MPKQAEPTCTVIECVQCGPGRSARLRSRFCLAVAAIRVHEVPRTTRNGLSCIITTMYFKQFYLGCLAHASYLIGSEGVAAVVDPQRDVDQYIEAAAAQGLKIKYIIETH